MAEFNRSLSTPVEARSRSRNHVSCPRCRVDPSHISRQFWEATARPDLGSSSISNSSVLEARSNGYPDLCRRSNRSYTSPASVHHYQNVRPVNAGYYTSATNSGHIRYSSDTHSTRSAGDTWRIRGILENHQPDVTRRAESSMGRLPDVTHHTQASSTIQHARTRSVPVGGVYDSRVPSSSSYDIHIQQHPPQLVSRSSTQGVICSRSNQDTHSNASLSAAAVTPSSRNHASNPSNHQRQELSSNTLAAPQWKRDQQVSNGSTSASPWVTRNAQMDRQVSANAASASHSNTNNSLTWPSQQQPSTSSSCWRPSTVTSPSQSVMNQCPLPDLVTPRRQARKQCCGLLATHSVAIRWLIVVIAALGLLCSVVGTIVGVVKATGREHLTVALLLIGLGIVLVSMSGVAWRLTSRESPSCRAMFGFRRARHEPHRRFVPRVPHYGRPHPFSAMLYPDISLRPPPPSYQASMQEYRLRLLLMDRQTPPVSHPPPPQPPPPPPMYRGPATVYPRFPVSIGISDYSRPPSYRSRPSSAGQPSPVGPEDMEIINNSSTSSSHHLPSDVIASSLTVVAQQQNQSSVGSARAAPSTVGAANHVEVVAQV